MDPQIMPDSRNQIHGKLVQDIKHVPKILQLDSLTDGQMTSSILSVTSSLTSPVDSGVQLLDSESDITSVMSMSETACDLESSSTYEISNTVVNNTPVKEVYTSNMIIENSKLISKDFLTPNTTNVMTKSDIANQNTTLPFDYGVYSSSAPNLDLSKTIDHQETISKTKHDLETKHGQETKFRVIDDQEASTDSKIDLELKTNVDIKPDTDEKCNKLDSENLESKPEGNIMHVSVSEEVNECLKLDEAQVNEVSSAPPPDEQIVFRRQRKKKSSKSETPKKRVSFHEDILNSTKIDDIHINHGFITHQPDISMSFFNWDSVRKRDVVKGRYSWAAEGDTPYYHQKIPEREVKSEIYMNSRYSSTSSSSTGSIDSTSSNSLCDNEDKPEGPLHNPTQKLPRSSCLKKRPPNKRIDTQIIQDDIGSLKQRKSESNLLDSNIFGSLKNILSFSTSVPLAERGVPEGQEDVDVHTCNKMKRRSFSLSNESIMSKSSDLMDKKITIESARNDLKLKPSEGFYPNYPVQNLPANIVICDSNVYEHKGISYSYEYDKFQKSLENTKSQKPKSSTVYQMLLQDLNFFKKKEKELSENNLKALAEASPTTPPPIPDSKPKKPQRSSITDFSSDTETVSDFSETISKHLSSPKHKINKSNHYSIQNFNKSDDSKFDDLKFPLKPVTSKSSLISRFLRNVTMKKLLDAKLQKKQKARSNKCMGLYVRGFKPDEGVCGDLDRELDEEILKGIKEKRSAEDQLGSSVVLRLKREVFREPQERLINFYKVHSAYSPDGETKPLLVFLTNSTLYITGFKPNQSFSNQFVLPYPELNTILIGPNAHTIHFSNCDREMQFIVSTGSAEITNNLIGQLEMSIRKNRQYPILPAVRHLSMREMAQLKDAICKQTAVDKEEEYFHYSIVNVQDAGLEPDSTPLGPVKKGPLMFKTANDIRWETGYFILKGGVLYIFSSPSNRLPIRVLPLGGGACLGAHRTPYCLRPHTFELLLGTIVLQLAAPDEYVASEWLQVLVQSASGLYNNDTHHSQSCSLLLTSQHILTMREKFPNGMPSSDYKAQALSCAAISDLTAFRIPLAEQSWCILEFACREVHETSGDLIIYFATNSELERFISTLEMLWTYNNVKGDSFPLTTIPGNEPISKRCEDAYRTQLGAWGPVNLVLQ